MSEQNRLQIWLDYGEVAVSQLFFKKYKQLNITDPEAMLLMHFHAFSKEGIGFPTPRKMAERMSLSEDEISKYMQRLMQKGVIEILQKVDEKGMICEVINLQPLWNHLIDLETKQEIKQQEVNQKMAEGEIFHLFEQELGRFLSPMESETIAMWLDVDGHSPEIIRKALMESVLSNKVNLRYVDRILFEWKKQNVKTTEDVDRVSKSFRENQVKKVATTPEVKNTTKKAPPLYNWLEERE